MKVIVVGNGASVLKNKQGKFIDDHDIVIRLGGYKIEGYENFVGSKTDIWSNGVSTIKIWKYFNEDVVNKHLWVMIPEDVFTDNEYLKKWQNVKYEERQFSQFTHNEKMEKLKLNNMVECISNRHLEILLEELMVEKYHVDSNVLRPTLGICTIFAALQKYNHVNIVGFDSLKTGWYWNADHIHTIGKHEPLMEKIWLAKMKKNNIITTYD